MGRDLARFLCSERDEKRFRGIKGKQLWETSHYFIIKRQMVYKIYSPLDLVRDFDYS